MNYLLWLLVLLLAGAVIAARTPADVADWGRVLNPFVAFRIYDRNKAAILYLKQMIEAVPAEATGS